MYINVITFYDSLVGRLQKRSQANVTGSSFWKSICGRQPNATLLGFLLCRVFQRASLTVSNISFPIKDQKNYIVIEFIILLTSMTLEDEQTVFVSGQNSAEIKF